jgi:hypothetical protein
MNSEYFKNFINSSVKPIGAAFIFLGIVTVAIQIILTSNNPKERSKHLSSIMYIGIGTCILGLAMTLYSIISSIATPLFVPGTAGPSISNETAVKIIEEKSDWISRLIASLIVLINEGIQTVLSGNVLENFNLHTVLFSKTVTSGSDGYWFLSIPLSTAKYLMYSLAIIVLPIIIIAIIRVATLYIASPFNITMRREATESIYRWILSIILIAASPMIVSSLIQLNNALVDGLSTLINNNISNDKLTLDPVIYTGSALLTAFVQLFFTLMIFKIVFMFAVRKIMILIFYAFTPIAALMWAIKKDVAAAGIWIGEMISNIFMQFFYALSYTVFVFMLSYRAMNWVETIIWTFMMITVSEALRNSMQGFVQRLSGIDESKIGSGMFAKLAGTAGVAHSLNAIKTTFATPESNVKFSHTNSKSSDTVNTKSGTTTNTGNSNINAKPIISHNSSNLNNNMPGGSSAGSNISGLVDQYGQPLTFSHESINNSRSNMGEESINLIKQQTKLAQSTGKVNAISKIASGMIGIPLAIAAAPLGQNMVKGAIGVSKVIGGSIRAVGTTGALVSLSASEANSIEDFKKNYTELMNSTTNKGTLMKTGSFIKNNTLGDSEKTQDLFNTISPTTNKQFVRWNYAPVTDDVDKFRWADKKLSPDAV